VETCFEDLELPPELRPPVVVERPEGSGVFVRLSDSYLWQIVYLGFPEPDNDRNITVHGTGFLMAHDGATYIVTAAHVAVDLMDSFGVRLNREDSGLGDIDRIDQAAWHFHPDNKVDVAVMPYQPPKWAKVNYSKSKFIASEFKVQSKNIGPGDLAYVIGVFQKMRGKDKNMPVVHTGHVAAMAYGEKMLTDDWRPGAKKGAMIEIEGYIVQVPTLPESSGSPVYVRRSIELRGAFEVNDEGTTASSLRTWTHGTVWLLGMWHGTWDSEEKSVIVGTNMGVCIPAPKIVEVLEKQELKAMREESKSRAAKTSALKPQSAAKARDEILATMLATPPQPRAKPARKRVTGK